LYLESDGLALASVDTGRSPEELERLFRKVVGNNALTGESNIKAWESVWLKAARLTSNYYEMPGGEFDVVKGADFSIKGSEVDKLVPEGAEMFLSDQAALTMGNIFDLMHDEGIVQIVDLFKGGRAKLAGSLYHPVNADVLKIVAGRFGFTSSLESFKYNPKSHSSIFTASR
jgi:hypothetical protein